MDKSVYREPMGPATGALERAEKHVSIQHALYHLDLAIGALERLLERIRDGEKGPPKLTMDRDCQDSPPQAADSLSEFLEKGPKEIHERANMIEDMTLQIKNMLF
jgi:hypothetical protein